MHRHNSGSGGPATAGPMIEGEFFFSNSKINGTDSEKIGRGKGMQNV